MRKLETFIFSRPSFRKCTCQHALHNMHHHFLLSKLNNLIGHEERNRPTILYTYFFFILLLDAIVQIGKSASATCRAMYIYSCCSSVSLDLLFPVSSWDYHYNTPAPFWINNNKFVGQLQKEKKEKKKKSTFKWMAIPQCVSILLLLLLLLLFLFL